MCFDFSAPGRPWVSESFLLLMMIALDFPIPSLEFDVLIFQHLFVQLNLFP